MPHESPAPRTSARRRLHRPAGVLLAALLLALVGTVPAAGGATAVTSTATSAVDTADVVEGTFDVGGHRLYLSCRGTGSPTVVYLHGAIWNPEVVPHRNAVAIRDRLEDDVRVCLYDRRNVGWSDTVDAIQEPKDAMRDLEGLLDAAGIEPPYVLLGASFGGLLSYLYANEHPDEVQGMVLLDAMFPDDLSLDPLWPREDWYQSFHADDQCCTPERISHWKVLKKSQKYIGDEPAIPVIYLTAEQDPRNTTGIPEYEALVLDVLAGYVDRFSPGEIRSVDAPHFMEPVVPDDIADAVLDVVELTR